MLPGSTADFQDMSGIRLEFRAQHLDYGSVVAMEHRSIQPIVGLGGCPVTGFRSICHGDTNLPKGRMEHCRAMRSPNFEILQARGERTLCLLAKIPIIIHCTALMAHKPAE